jgi:hypothetical protein
VYVCSFVNLFFQRIIIFKVKYSSSVLFFNVQCNTNPPPPPPPLLLLLLLPPPPPLFPPPPLPPVETIDPARLFAVLPLALCGADAAGEGKAVPARLEVFDTDPGSRVRNEDVARVLAVTLLLLLLLLPGYTTDDGSRVLLDDTVVG